MRHSCTACLEAAAELPIPPKPNKPNMWLLVWESHDLPYFNTSGNKLHVGITGETLHRKHVATTPMYEHVAPQGGTEQHTDIIARHTDKC